MAGHSDTPVAVSRTTRTSWRARGSRTTRARWAVRGSRRQSLLRRVRTTTTVLGMLLLVACGGDGPDPATHPAWIPGIAVNPAHCTQALHASTGPETPAEFLPITFFQAGHGWWGSGTDATFQLDDPTDTCLGTQSAWMRSGGTGQNTRIGHTGIGPYDFTDRDVVVWVKVDDWAHLDVLRLWLSSDEGISPTP